MEISATHLLRKETNLRYIQALLGLSSSGRTETYTPVLSIPQPLRDLRFAPISNKNIQCPLDKIEEIPNLVSPKPRTPEDKDDIDAIA